MGTNSFYDQLIQAISMPFLTFFGNQSDSFGEKRIYWIYLLSSLLLAFCIYFYEKRKESFGKYIFNKKVWLSKSACIDYIYIFFNSFVKVFLLSIIFRWAPYFVFYLEDFLVMHFGYSQLTFNIWWASFFFLIAFTLVEDFFSFLIHWLFHKIPILWQFHKVHHSATVMNPITQYRIHPVELLFNNISYLIALGLVQGIFSWIYFSHKEDVTYISTNVFTILFFFSGANLRHSHVKLRYFSFLENFFISPFQHQIHHSNDPKHFNKNLGSKFALWDILFGTLVKSHEAKYIKFGIGTKENKDFDTFFKTLWKPFFKMFKTNKE